MFLLFSYLENWKSYTTQKICVAVWKQPYGIDKDSNKIDLDNDEYELIYVDEYEYIDEDDIGTYNEPGLDSWFWRMHSFFFGHGRILEIRLF